MVNFTTVFFVAETPGSLGHPFWYFSTGQACQGIPVFLGGWEGEFFFLEDKNHKASIPAVFSFVNDLLKP